MRRERRRASPAIPLEDGASQGRRLVTWHSNIQTWASPGNLLRTLARCVPPGLLRPFGRPVVLAFHGLVTRIADERIEVAQHERDVFHAIVKTLKAQFDVLPLGAIADVGKNPGRYPRAVFLTADDGYSSLDAAADLLEEQRLPWSLFVPTHHIETGQPNPLFPARLFLLFGPTGTYEIPHIPTPIVLGTQRGALCIQVISELKRLDRVRAEEAVAAMAAVFSASEFDALRARFASERYLDWDGVAQLARRGVAIGAHAHWHWPMNAAEPTSALAMQAETSRALVISHIGQCRYFAYPFGREADVSPQARNAVRDAGFEAAFTSIPASLEAKQDPFLLPRYFLARREPALASFVPLIRAGGFRARNWQRATLSAA